MRSNKIVIFFSKINFFLFVIVLFLAWVILNFLLIKILPENVLRIPDIVVKISYSWFGKVLIVIIGPAIETLFFQVIPISSIRAMVSKESSSFFVSTLVSALAFSLAHGIYGKYYMLYAFVSGLLLAISYNLSIHRKEPPFLSVFILHVLWNFLVLLLLEAGILNNII